MMKNMKTIKNILKFGVLAAGVALATSCESRLDLEPKYGFNSEVIYSNPDNYINVLAKLYSGLGLSGIQGPAGNADIQGIDEGFSSYIRVLYNLQEVSTDVAVCGWNDPGIPELNRQQWSPDNSFVKAMYARIFYQITLANEFMRESSDESMADRGFSDADQARIRQYRAEARFLRALSYYHAIDMFGNVPHITEEDKIGAFVPERITRTNLFTYLENELKALEGELASYSADLYGRANKEAAQFLLAKLYLNAEVYSGSERYADCAEYAQRVINSGAFAMETTYQHLFLADNEYSPEAIFSVTFDGTRTQTYGATTFLTHAAVGGTMVPADFGISGGWYGLRTTRPFVEHFPDSMLDGRYLFYRDGQNLDIASLGVFSDGYGLPKFKNVTSNGDPGSNASGGFVDIDFHMFRLADAYLMYSEAAARGAADQSTGLSYLNAVRERAYGNSSYNFSSYTAEDVLQERARELYWEGTRRTDLIRYGKFTGGDYLWPFKGGVLEGASSADFLNLFPLPTSDLVLNPNLVQNPGY